MTRILVIKKLTRYLVNIKMSLFSTDGVAMNLNTNPIEGLDCEELPATKLPDPEYVDMTTEKIDKLFDNWFNQSP